MKILLALALITLPISVEAATVHNHHKPVHRVQQHYSFIPPRQAPVIKPKTVESMPLTGQVQQIIHPVEPMKPPSCSPLAMPTANPSIPVTRKRVAFFWKQHIVATRFQSAAIPMTANEAAQLSSAATAMIASLSRTDTPIFLLPSPQTDHRSDTFTPSLMHNLRNAGYQLALEPNEHSIPVRYRVSHYQNSYLIHITVKSIQLARLFKVIEGSSIAVSPLSSTQEQP